MGGNGDIDLSTIPLMTQAQEGALAELLPAVMGMMSGFPLGEAYQPGAYNVRTFPEFSMEHIVKKNGEGDSGGDKIRREQLKDPSKRITKEQLARPSDRTVSGGDGKTVIRDGTVVPKTNGGTVSGEQISEPLLDLILNPVSPVGPPPPQAIAMPPDVYGGVTAPGTIGGQVTPPDGIMPGGKSEVPTTTNIPNVQIPESQPISPVQQTFTEPIIQPFREGMTGNYPGRQGRRAGGQR